MTEQLTPNQLVRPELGQKRPAQPDYFDAHPDLVASALSIARGVKDQAGIVAIPGDEGDGIQVRPKGSIDISSLVAKSELSQEEAEMLAAPLAPHSIKYDPHLLEAGYHEAVGILKLYAELSSEFQRVDLVRSIHQLAKTGLSPENLQITLDSIRHLIQVGAWLRLSKRLGEFGMEKLRTVVNGILEAQIQESGAFAQYSPEDQAVRLAALRALKKSSLADTPALNELEGILNLTSQRATADLLEALEELCLVYVQSGEWPHLSHLTDQLVDIKKNGLSDPAEKEDQEDKNDQDVLEESEEMQGLREELEKISNEQQPTGYNTAQDPSIPPSERTQYPPSPEKGQKQLLYEIKPLDPAGKPITGHARSRVKSKFDINTKQWIYTSKQSLSSWTISESMRPSVSQQVISGRAGTELISLPVPARYSVDRFSLKLDGGVIDQVYIDQNGCFFLKLSQASDYQINFWLVGNGLEQTKPLPENLENICGSELSSQTEQVINVARSVKGGSVARAHVLRQYLLKNHFYPAGGDLDLALALQYKLLQSPASEYIKALDDSEYLECKSANTLFIAMARKVGIPARLIEGYKYSKVQNNTAQITSDDGHAWAEVWDDSTLRWVRFDATPEPKEEDVSEEQREKQEEEKNGDQGDSAQDGGKEAPSKSNKKSKSKKSGNRSTKSGQGEDPPSQVGEDESDQGGEPEMGEQSSTDSSQVDDQEKDVPKDDAEATGDETGGAQSDSDQAEVEQGESEEAGEGSMPDEEAIKKLQDFINQQQPDSDTPQEVGKLDKLDQKQRRLDDNAARSKQRMIEENSFDQLRKLQQELEAQEMTDSAREELQRQIDEKVAAKKKQLKDQLAKIAKTGFINEDQQRQFEQQIDRNDGRQLDRLVTQIDQTVELHRQYTEIQRQVTPLVDMYFEQLAAVLPKELILGWDQLASREDGEFDEELLLEPDSRILHEFFHPPMEQESREPRLIVTILVDLSLSMEMENRLPHVRKLLVFFCELFDRISKTYGPIRFAIHTFARSIESIKGFDQDYGDDNRYLYQDGPGRSTTTTVKARLMQVTERAREYSLLLEALQHVRSDMDREISKVPDPNDFAKLVILLIDGEDTYKRTAEIRQIVSGLDQNYKGGLYPFKAMLMGDERLRRELLQIFDPNNIEVANDFVSLVNQTMLNIEATMRQYFSEFR